MLIVDCLFQLRSTIVVSLPTKSSHYIIRHISSCLYALCIISCPKRIDGKKGELRETRERDGEKGERERGRGKKVVVVQPRFRSVLLRKGISTAENRREKRQKKKKEKVPRTRLFYGASNEGFFV